MATPRRPYVRVRQGWIEDALAVVSDSAGLLLARLQTHRDKRAIPGLLRLGAAGLTESLIRASLPAVKRDLEELQRARLVMVDLSVRPPFIYVHGSVEADPPTTENAVRAMARQTLELPSGSPVVAEVRRAISEALAGSTWLTTWREIVGPEPAPDVRPESIPDSGLGIGSRPGPLHRSIEPTTTDPKTTDPETERAFDRFWAAYPRKVGKDAARRAWKTRRITSELLESILIAIAWQKRSEVWRKDDGQYIPHPATWLNQGRWQDEPDGDAGDNKDADRSTTWSKVAARLQGQLEPEFRCALLSPHAFYLAFNEAREVEHTDAGELVLEVPSASHVDWIRKHCGAQLETAIADVGVPGVILRSATEGRPAHVTTSQGPLAIASGEW